MATTPFPSPGDAPTTHLPVVSGWVPRADLDAVRAEVQATREATREELSRHEACWRVACHEILRAFANTETAAGAVIKACAGHVNPDAIAALVQRSEHDDLHLLVEAAALLVQESL